VPVETAEDVIANPPEQPRVVRSTLFADAGAPDSAAGVAGLVPESPLPPDSAAEPAAGWVQVLDFLGPSPTPVDAVMRRCQLSPPAVMAVVLELELAGRIATLPGGRVAVLADSPA
jgi:DNA processing protein